MGGSFKGLTRVELERLEEGEGGGGGLNTGRSRSSVFLSLKENNDILDVRGLMRD